MKKTTKILAVLSIYFLLLVIDGCTNCDCPNNVLDFFDFKKIQQDVNATSLSEFDKLEINLSFDSISYLAQLEKKPCWNLGLISTASACSCISQGESGLKFPISQIKITSDQAVNSNLPAGVSLDSGFYLIELDHNNDEISKTLLIDYNSSSGSLNWEGARFQLQSVSRPEDLNVPHIFNIEFTKSNGEIISSQTPPITWN